MNEGSMGRAIYDFTSAVEGEISLRSGQIVQVRRRVDSHWYFGNQADRLGNFPASYIVEVSVPPFKDGQRVFVSLQPFNSKTPGDLMFDKDEIIIGLFEVDSNWWNGSCGGMTGIFPLTYVWEADATYLKKRVTASKVRKKARVKLDLKAQLDEEMDMQKGDIVTITEILDKDWYRGECSGKTGIFPASFVVVLDDGVEKAETVPDAAAAVFSSSNNSEFTNSNPKFSRSSSQSSIVTSSQNHPGTIAPYARTLFPFTPQYSSELGFEAGETVTLLRHVDNEWVEGRIGNNTGIFPKSYVDVVVDCNHILPEEDNHFTEFNHSVITNNSQVEVVSGQTQAQVLYDYFAQTEGDLTLVEDEIITIFRQLNPDWYEAVDCQGNFGLCPSNYLQLLPNKQKMKQPESANEECSGLSSSDSWELMSNSMLNTSDSSSSINRSNLSSDGSFVIVPEPSSWHLPQNKEPNKPSPVAQNCTKQNNSTLGRFPRSMSSNTSPDALDKSILRNLNNLDLTLAASQKKPPERSQSFNESCYRNQSVQSRNEGKPLEQSTGNAQRRRTGSFQLSRPPPRPPPPVAKSHTALKQTKPPRPTSIPFLKTLKEDSTDVGVLPAKSDSVFPQESQVNSINLMEKRPSRRAPSPPKTAIQHYAEQQDKMILVPHRPAPPVPYSSRLSSSSRGSREFASQRRESIGTTVRFRNRMHEPNIIENDSRQLPEVNQGSKRLRTLSMGTDTNVEGPCLINDMQIRNHKENNMEKRQMVIKELLQTEQTYIRDLRLCTSTFLQNPEEAKTKGIDIDTAFGNLMDVVDVAEKLYASLLTATSTSSNKILIGPCFQNLEEKMKQVYGNYCANHAESIQLLEKYQENPEIENYFVKKMEIINMQISCLNLNALLIKPVQRILKYPLLLDALIKCTDDDHEDKIELEKTRQLMANLAGFVNEFKRRKDIVSKYLKDEDTSLSAMLSKLNLHSVVKKSTRFGMRLSSSIGLTSVTKDEAFDSEEEKFHALEKAVKCFEKDVTTFCKHLEEWAKTQFELSEGAASFYMDECRRVEVERFRNVQRELYAFILTDLKNSVGKRVEAPLSLLIKTFTGPAKLIEKRYHKLLDYDSSTHRLEKNKDSAKSFQLREEHDMIHKNYEALNAQLIEELPKFFNAALSIFQDCVREFLVARKRFIGKYVKEMLPLAELPSLVNVHDDILERFNAQHAESTSEFLKLTFIPKNLFYVKPESKDKSDKNQRSRSRSPRNAVQTDDVRRKLRSAYPKQKLYVSTSLYDAKDEFELSMNGGDLLGVVMEKDPMGVTSRWFVDNGVAKGFVPSTCLEISSDSANNSVHGLGLDLPNVNSGVQSNITISITEPDLELTDRYDIPFESPDRYELPFEDSSDRYDYPNEEFASPEITNGANVQPDTNSRSPTDEYYYATYDFSASTASELSLQSGQVVLVVRKSDLEGNPEWWLIQDRFNNRGFAPANYLNKYNG